MLLKQSRMHGDAMHGRTGRSVRTIAIAKASPACNGFACQARIYACHGHLLNNWRLLIAPL